MALSALEKEIAFQVPKISELAASTKCSSEVGTSICREAVHANCARILRDGLPAAPSALTRRESAHVRVLEVEAGARTAPGLRERRRRRPERSGQGVLVQLLDRFLQRFLQLESAFVRHRPRHVFPAEGLFDCEVCATIKS